MNDKLEKLCMEADKLLKPLLTKAANDYSEHPESETLQTQYRALLFLARLNQRENQVAHVRSSDNIMKLARLLGTDYLRFSIYEVGIELYCVYVFDEMLHCEVAELIFKKTHNSYFMEDYKFL